MDVTCYPLPAIDVSEGNNVMLCLCIGKDSTFSQSQNHKQERQHVIIVVRVTEQ